MLLNLVLPFKVEVVDLMVAMVVMVELEKVVLLAMDIVLVASQYLLDYVNGKHVGHLMDQLYVLLHQVVDLVVIGLLELVVAVAAVALSVVVVVVDQFV